MDKTSPEKPFMTPAQQRAYLSDLRKQNEELYGLTGPRIGTGRNPWETPVANPRVCRQSSSSSNSLRDDVQPAKGPPKPPKSDQVRGLHTVVERSLSSQASITEASQTPEYVTRARPKSLPKPPQLSQSLPKVDSLNLGNKAASRKLPPVPQKPSSHIKSSPPAEDSSPRRVALSLTNYDIPQAAHHDTSNAIATDPFQQRSTDEEESFIREQPQDKKISIPVFSFHEPELTKQNSNFSTTDDSIPSFVVTPVLDESASSNPARLVQDNFPPTIAVSSHDTEAISNDTIHSQFSESTHAQRRKRRPRISEAQQDLIQQGLCCANCYEPLGRGRIITANGKRYHPNHFLCFECGIPLEHVEFYVQPSGLDGSDNGEGEIYCHFDYHELFSDRCFVCTTPVIRDGIKALGKTYHAEHFFCALCSQTFTRANGESAEFVEKDNLAWHPACYEEKFSISYMCRKCKKKIAAGAQVITMGTGSHFHSECFLCAHCRGSLADGFYWSSAKEGVCRHCKEIEVKNAL